MILSNSKGGFRGGPKGAFFPWINLYYFYRILRKIKSFYIIIAGKCPSHPFLNFLGPPQAEAGKMSSWEISPFLITYLETKNQFPHTANNTKCTCMYCMPLSKWNKLCKRFQLNPTNPVAQRRQKWLRFVEMGQMERSRLEGTWERTNNFFCQGLDGQPFLCIFLQ